MSTEILDYLASSEGIKAIESAKGLDPYKASDAAKLRKNCTLQQAGAIFELIELRSRARAKFSRAEKMFFDRAGYEQSSSEKLAEYKASRIRKLAGSANIFDLCCGIGGDTIALAKHGKVSAVDNSPTKIHIAELNLKVYQRSKNCKFLCEDVETLNIKGDIFHLDPDQRKIRGRRSFNIDDLSPGMDYVGKLLKQSPAGAIKLSPGMDYSELPWDGEIEIISSDGQCRQMILWMGKLAKFKLRATSLDTKSSITDEQQERLVVSDLGKYLYDPDPSVSRLKLLGQLAGTAELNFLAPGQIVLTSDNLNPTPMARVYKVKEVMSFHENKLKRYFRDINTGIVTIKPRGVMVNVEKLSKRFSGKGNGDNILFLLRIDKKIVAVISERISH